MTPKREPDGTWSAPFLHDDGQIVLRYFDRFIDAQFACLTFEHAIKTKQSGGIMLRNHGQ